jgi:hypothetical protein
VHHRQADERQADEGQREDRGSDDLQADESQVFPRRDIRRLAAHGHARDDIGRQIDRQEQHDRQCEEGDGEPSARRADGGSGVRIGLHLRAAGMDIRRGVLPGQDSSRHRAQNDAPPCSMEAPWNASSS